MSHGSGLLERASAEAAPAVERRGAPRHPILQRCLVWPPGPRGPEGWRSIAYNISSGGLGLTLPFAAQVGAVVEVEPWGLPGARPVRTRVVRTNPVEFVWFCGAEFLEPLGEEQLRAWRAGTLHWLPPERLLRLT